MNAPPYLWVYLFFVSLVVAGFLLIIVSAALQRAGQSAAFNQRVRRRAGIVVLGWLAIVGWLGWAGVFAGGADQRFPLIAPAIFGPIVLGTWFIRRSETLAILIAAVPHEWLAVVQTFRGFGAIFLVLHGVGLIPGVFALPAGFGDVAVGLLALPLTAALSTGLPQSHGWLRAWNVLGIADLAVAVGTGFLSAPGPLQVFAREAPNALVGQFPLVLIPVYAVPISILLHVASLTKLGRESSVGAGPAPAGSPRGLRATSHFAG